MGNKEIYCNDLTLKTGGGRGGGEEEGRGGGDMSAKKQLASQKTFLSNGFEYAAPLFLLLISAADIQVEGFILGSNQIKLGRPMPLIQDFRIAHEVNSALSLKQPGENDDNDPAKIFSKKVDKNTRIEDDLRPPLFNLRKESILFDDTAATRRNNNIVRFWQFVKNNLPRIIHGAPRSRRPLQRKEVDDERQSNREISRNRKIDGSDANRKISQVTAYTRALEQQQQQQLDQEDPVALLYNMAFVRIPTIAAGLVYLYNAAHGHPLIIDFGDGPFEVPPFVVVGGLYIFLML